MPPLFDDMWKQLGAIAKRCKDIRTAQLSLAPNDLTTASGLNVIRALYDAGEQSMISSISDQNAVGDFGRSALQPLRDAASRTLIDTIDASVPLQSRTVNDALREVSAQLVGNSDEFLISTVGASVAARSGNTGTGTVATTLLGPTNIGRGVSLAAATQSQTIRAEKWRATCIGDANAGFAAGNELFRIDTARSFPPLDRRWRAGTGGSSFNVNATSSTVESSPITGQNIIRNGAFERVTSNVPEGWTVRSGTAGSTILTTATAYDGVLAMRFVGDGATSSAIRSQFGSSDGTPILLMPDRTYKVRLATRSNSGTVTKTLTVTFADSSGATVALSGAQGLAITSHTTSYSLSTADLHTPANLTPGTYYLDIANTGTALAGGEEIYFDGLVVAEVVRATPMSGGIVIIGGGTQFRQDDHFDITWTNDAAGEYLYWLDYFFDIYHSGIPLPVIASPSETIPNSYIA